ncbi:MAG: YkvA family protein [Devosia sp.]
MGRLLQFRTELMLLWRAFMAPETPLHLKALMLLVPLYLVSPIDFIPDVVPVLGWLDDVVVIPLLVSWIVGLLPRKVEARATRPRSDGKGGPVIDADYRRL